MRRYVLWAGVALGAALATILVAIVAVPVARNFASQLLGISDDTDAVGPTPIQGADLTGSGPGTLVSAVTMPNFSRTREAKDLQAARVVYRSTSGDTGQQTEVSGSVFVPAKPAPPGGWPVVAFGHGSTGIDEPCAPSLSNSLLDQSIWVARFIARGYAVAFADFQGLGAPGVHPYLDARTAGLNIIDSVRALRHTFKDVSNRWLAFGGSQGGAAVWAADEQAATYAPELDLVGAVAIAPAADVTGLVDNALAGTLTDKQGPALQWIIESLARLHPDLNRDDYRHGAAAEHWDALTACSGPAMHDRRAAMAELGPGDLAPSTPQAADRLRELLRQWALPQRPLSAPLSVVYGGEDAYINPQWTTDAIARACALGGTVVWDLQPEKGHGDVDMTPQLPWLEDRFANKPVTNECA
jgi:hypothetical protein